MMLENKHTALNGTTTTTTTTEKKGYTPLVVWFTFFTTTLLLGLAFYAGQPIRSSYGVGGSGGAASLYGNKNAGEDWCDCASCHWSYVPYYAGNICVCTPPSETVHCPATVSSYCPSAAMIFAGPAVDCTQIIIGVNNDGWTCNDIVAHMKMNFVYYNCMDGPSSANGACANKNVCEYPNGNHP